MWWASSGQSGIRTLFWGQPEPAALRSAPPPKLDKFIKMCSSAPSDSRSCDSPWTDTLMLCKGLVATHGSPREMTDFQQHVSIMSKSDQQHRMLEGWADFLVLLLPGQGLSRLFLRCPASVGSLFQLTARYIPLSSIRDFFHTSPLCISLLTVTTISQGIDPCAAWVQEGPTLCYQTLLHVCDTSWWSRAPKVDARHFPHLFSSAEP